MAKKLAVLLLVIVASFAAGARGDQIGEPAVSANARLAGPQRHSSSQVPDLEALGLFLDDLMLEHEIPGFGFALFDDEGLLYEHVGGLKSRTDGEPIDRNTAFEAASISKPVFAYVAHSLMREGRLALGAPLDTLVEEVPELAYDPRVSALTPEILLSHRGGLPNWRSRLRFAAQDYSELFAPDDRLEFIADPATGYHYSGEGYVLLQRVVQEMTGEGLNELAKARVFDPLAMARSSFLFDAETRENYALGHDRDGNPDKWEIYLPLASSTLHTTAADLARFGSHLASQIRTGGPYAALAAPAVLVAEADGKTLHWGQGLGLVTDASRRYVYHGGNNVIFIADLMYGIEENLGYVLLTNSSNGQAAVDAVEQRIFGRRVRR